jgi:hypothetical protein
MSGHYVYSARTTEQGLALLNKAKGEKGWDAFVNEAVCQHYGLDPAAINLPPSKYLLEREEKRKAKEAEKARKAAEKKAKAKPKKAAKKTAKEEKKNGK